MYIVRDIAAIWQFFALITFSTPASTRAAYQNAIMTSAESYYKMLKEGNVLRWRKCVEIEQIRKRKMGRY